MYKRVLIIIIVMTLILTGCTKIDNNLDIIIDTVMNGKNISANTVSTGYELYIPVGVMQLSDNEYNQKLKIRDRYIYLYVDTISYYYKNSLNYKSDDDYNYYYKEINFNNKVGYIGINKLDDNTYFCESIYNNSKIEFYTDIEDLSYILTNSLIIQNNIKFNDELIKIELEGSISDSREMKYELDKPKDSESTFSKYLQEYVPNTNSEVVLPDED